MKFFCKKYLLLFFLLSSCERERSFRVWIDSLLLHSFGYTLFENSQHIISIKEILLGRQELLSKSLVIDGHISHIGKFHTYLVLEDQGARLLVVLTNIVHNYRWESIQRKPQKLRVVGVLKNGKMALPYLLLDHVYILSSS